MTTSTRSRRALEAGAMAILREVERAQVGVPERGEPPPGSEAERAAQRLGARPVRYAPAALRKVSLWLGHASTQTTDIYLQGDPKGVMSVLGALTAGAPGAEDC